jgi:hypothetical protein
MPLLALVIIVLVAAGAITFSVLDIRKRRETIAAWARARELRLVAFRDGKLDDGYPDFKCLHVGRSRYARNVYCGELCELAVTAFDYHYTTGSGKNRQHHRMSALIARSPLPLQPLLVRREHALDRLAGFFGLEDIDFESAEFSQKFFVKAASRRWAFDVIHPRMMEFLLQAPSFSIQFAPGHIIAWRRHRFAPGDFESAAGLIKGMLDRLPDYVVEQQRKMGGDQEGHSP